MHTIVYKIYLANVPVNVKIIYNHYNIIIFVVGNQNKNSF